MKKSVITPHPYIDKICVNNATFTKLPKKYAYTDNKSFVMAVATAWLENFDHNATINPYMFYKMLKEYNILTNRGEGYTYNSRGPFNLIRSAYKKAEGYWANCNAMLYDPALQDAESKKRIQQDINHWKKIMDAIALAFVNADDNYAYEH